MSKVLRCLPFPESVSPPEAQVDRAKSNGMDVLCITDHNETEGAFKARAYAERIGGIEVVIGEEINTLEGEIIGLFLTERIERDLSLDETIDEIRSQGGLTVAPHPFSAHVPGIKERVSSADLDGIEVINGGHPDRYANKAARTVADACPGRWARMAGSDAHSTRAAGYCWTEFEGGTADEFRKSVLRKTTAARGVATPVLETVKWSMEVVRGGQKLLYRSLKGGLGDDNPLFKRINGIDDGAKKIAGIIGGAIYVMPPVMITASVATNAYVSLLAHRKQKDLPCLVRRIEEATARALGGGEAQRPRFGARPGAAGTNE
jgi:predicted metal-dependent phosphoesterase TrpH